MEAKFIFTRENRWLKKYYDLWKKGKEFGCYVLIGPSGGGKTLFVKELLDELGKSYRIYTGKELEELIFRQVRECKLCKLETAEIMIFEDIDCLLKSPVMRSRLEKIVRRYEFDENGEKRLIFMTAIDFMACQLYGHALPVNLLKITPRAVWKKAKQYQMRLSFAEVIKLSKCKRMSQLETEFRKKKINAR